MSSRVSDKQYYGDSDIFSEGYANADHSEADVLEVVEGSEVPAANNAMQAARRGTRCEVRMFTDESGSTVNITLQMSHIPTELQWFVFAKCEEQIMPSRQPKGRMDEAREGTKLAGQEDRVVKVHRVQENK